MRKSKLLFPLLSGLVLTMTAACGDDGSDDTDSTDTTATNDEDASAESTDSQSSTDDSESDTTAVTTDGNSDSDQSQSGEDTDDGGGATDDDGGANEGDGGDGGTNEDIDGSADGGADGGDRGEGDADVDAAPLPEGACADSPANPDNGTYAQCDGTLNGGTCQLDCNQDNFIGGLATCTNGEWAASNCVRLGSLTAEIGNAATGADLAEAVVYIEGFYDPASDNCEESVYCDITGDNGVVDFEDFPSGPQQVVIVKEGFDQIALPVNIAPGDERSIHLDALPTGFLGNNIVILLSWEVGTDLDLLLKTPGTDAGEGQCVFYGVGYEGSLTSEPFAQLDYDNKAPNAKGPETIRIALNENGAPYHPGTYSVVVGAHASRSLNEAIPSVRVIRAGDNGSANVELFVLPDEIVDEATEWHVLDLDEGGTTPNGATEFNPDDASNASIPCVEEVFSPQ